MAKVTLNDGDMFKTVNKYYGNKNRQWESKEVSINVLSEGSNGKVQNIGSSKFNLSHFVSQYFNSPPGDEPQTFFMQVVSFPLKGLVGDLELQVTLTPPSKDKIRGRSTGRQTVNASAAINPSFVKKSTVNDGNGFAGANPLAR
jgi:hypothetical protein